MRVSYISHFFSYGSNPAAAMLARECNSLSAVRCQATVICTALGTEMFCIYCTHPSSESTKAGTLPSPKPPCKITICLHYWSTLHSDSCFFARVPLNVRRCLGRSIASACPPGWSVKSEVFCLYMFRRVTRNHCPDSANTFRVARFSIHLSREIHRRVHFSASHNPDSTPGHGCQAARLRL